MIGKTAPSCTGWRNLRYASLALVASLPGCASPPPMQAAKPTPVAPVAAAQSSTDKTIFPGYHKVEKNGEIRYCRVETATGTRVGQKTICLTEEQLRQQGIDNQRVMENASRRQLPCSESAPC